MTSPTVITISRIRTLSEQFNLHRDTHPILSNLWVTSLEDCKLKLYIIKKTVEQGELLIGKLPNDIVDPTMSTIITLLSMLGGPIDDSDLGI